MDDRVCKALEVASEYGSIDGDHHKMWVIDQMVRCLTNCPTVVVKATDCHGKEYSYESLGESDEYKEWVRRFCDGEDGSNTYAWDIGIAP